jgi:hypothetical protein
MHGNTFRYVAAALRQCWFVFAQALDRRRLLASAAPGLLLGQSHSQGVRDASGPSDRTVRTGCQVTTRDGVDIDA